MKILIYVKVKEDNKTSDLYIQSNIKKSRIEYNCPWFSLSSLFPDVVNCMQTDNLELKKLVYLYLMNYAKSQPDMAIMAVNTFVKVRCVYCMLAYRATVLFKNGK